ncbi:hypothetical protein ACHAXA_009228 [Cyclostephanos tholiformis]|uniref:Uncharacterized protein n=1 Tax=Cyclostephanos tholiformis TaxID=382380 RepID=A0ABD3R6P4_9STRA
MKDITTMTQVRNGSVSKDTSGVKRGKKATVSFPEMLRLMKTYGSIKCLRNHQKKGDNINAKEDSIRRKFYRWFPDLDERFERDEKGIYHPKAGHEFEIIYRGKLRKMDGEILSMKRTGSRKEHSLNPSNKPSKEKVLKGTSKKALIMARVQQAGIIVDASDGGSSPIPVLSAQSDLEDDEMDAFITRNFPYNPQESAAIISDIEPVDTSFVAAKEIFDDVETIFFSPTIQECPRSQMQARSPTPCNLTQENANLNRLSQILEMSDTYYSIHGRCDWARRSTCESDADTAFFNNSQVKSVEELKEDDILVSEDSESVLDVVSDDNWDLI